MKFSASRRRALYFCIATLGLSYLVFWGPIALAKVPTISFVDKTKGPAWAIALFVLGGFVPSVVGLVAMRVSRSREALRTMLRQSFKLGLGLRWYAVIVALIVGGAVGQLLTNAVLGGGFDFSLFLIQLPSLLPLLVLGPLSEEYGWRGFLLGELLEDCSPLAASVIVGLVWGLWHLPLFLMAGSSQNVLRIPFGGFIAYTMAMSVIMTWIMHKAQGLLWSAIFLHWINTYFMQVVSSGVTRNPSYNWLEYAPFVLIAVVLALADRGFFLRSRAGLSQGG